MMLLTLRLIFSPSGPVHNELAFQPPISNHPGEETTHNVCHNVSAVTSFFFVVLHVVVFFCLNLRVIMCSVSLTWYPLGFVVQ